MDTSTIKQKIDALNAAVVANSVSPETVASILYDLLKGTNNLQDLLKKTDSEIVVVDSIEEGANNWGFYFSDLKTKIEDKSTLMLVDASNSNLYLMKVYRTNEITLMLVPTGLSYNGKYYYVQSKTYSLTDTGGKINAKLSNYFNYPVFYGAYSPVQKFNASLIPSLVYTYDGFKIVSLSNSSDNDEIVAAFTTTYNPNGANTFLLPQVGALLKSSSGAIGSVIKNTSTGFTAIFGRHRYDITLSGSSGSYKVTVKKTQLDIKVYDLDKINALTGNSGADEVKEAFGGFMYPVTGDLLQGAKDNAWVICSHSEQDKYIFSYVYNGYLHTLTLLNSGQELYSISVEKEKVSPKRYDFFKINNLSDGSIDADIDAAITSIDGTDYMPKAGDLLVDHESGYAISTIITGSHNGDYSQYAFTYHYGSRLTSVVVKGQRGDYTVSINHVNVNENNNIKSLADGAGSGSTVGSVGTKVNMWEYYWREVWEESEPAGLYHANQVGVSGVKSEMQSAGFPIEPPGTVTDAETLVAWMKTQEIDMSGLANKATGYGSVTYGLMNENAAPCSVVEGERNKLPDKFFRSHVEGGRHDLSQADYHTMGHVEGQMHKLKGYGTAVHMEGNSCYFMGTNPQAKEDGSYSQGGGPSSVHIEGYACLADALITHVEGEGSIVLGHHSHAEGFGDRSRTYALYQESPTNDTELYVTLQEEWMSITPASTVYRFQVTCGWGAHVEGFGNFERGVVQSSNTEVNKANGFPDEIGEFFSYPANHVEGVYNYVYAYGSHTEGVRNENRGCAAHVEGFFNKVQNAGEHASGYWNASHKASVNKGDKGNTLFSIGCGTSEDDRKNAFEVMQEGTAYLLDPESGEIMTVQEILRSAKKAIALKEGQGLRIGADGNIEIDVESLKQLLGLA